MVSVTQLSGARKTGEVGVDLYLLWARQKTEGQGWGPQRRILDSVRLGSAVYWFIIF